MKKIQNWVLTLMAFLTVGFALTSCDEDIEQAHELSGEWRGDFGMYYEDRYGICYDAEYTIIEFYRNAGTSSGYGYQYDKYYNAPISSEYHRFNWTIRNGVLYLSYPYDHSLDTEIYDYKMSRDYFTGYFGSTGSSFRLFKTAGFGWDDYTVHGDYYYEYDYGYYGLDSKAMNGAPQQEEVKAEDIIVRHGNRLAEGAKTE